MQVDLESLIDNNNPLLSKKIIFQSETFSHKDTSNMLHSTIVGSRVSTSNLNYSLINQDCSPLNTSPQLQSNNYFPQINILNKSTDEEDIDNQIEQKPKSFNMQNIIKLPSQRVIYGRLKTLLSDKKRLVIKIWGSDWDGILEELNVENDKIKVVNKNNKQNHNIFSVMSKEDFEKELKDKK